MLTVQAVTCRFGGLTAVNQVSLTVDRGEIFGLIGPNGAGKTTLFNLITGLIQANAGAVLYKDRNITRLRPYQIAALGIARTFQNIRLFGERTLLDNLLIAHHLHCRIHPLADILGLGGAQQEERQIRRQSLELLELVGLADRANESARNLPYGDQRRLEIVRALALRPQLLLLDEPAAGMNPSEKAQLGEFIRHLRAQFSLTVILIEHHVPMVMGLCERIAVLDFGQLIALGSPTEVKDDPAVIEAYLGEAI